ncbi:MAG: TonB-dependent receptor [Bacteroidetes bacterium]|nr:MAG: TonB-dependent receptor [Bacteroidota bacterium]
MQQHNSKLPLCLPIAFARRASFLLLCMLVWSVGALAQTVQVTGTVTDEEGDPLVGATVLIQGTTTGVLTDAEGKFSINAEKGTTLLISMVTYQPQTIVVGDNTTNLSISLAPNTLDEVVVTGYTSERKADIVGSVSVINTKDMLSAPSANLTGQLQGRASGVVVSNDSRPGAGAKVRIRGFTSFGSSNPLYVIDGVPTKDPSKINPNDIESVQVLKDATAASIYGTRAAQGVIIITTKGGTQGDIQLSYDGYYGVQAVPKSAYPEVLNTQEYVEYLQKNNGPNFIHPVFGSMTNPTIPDRIVVSPTFKGGVSANDPRAADELYDISDFSRVYQIMETSPGTNWFDAALRPAIVQNHQVSARGGGEKGSYSFSMNYFGQEGMYEYTDYNRYAARMNTSFNPVKWLRVGENFQFLYDKGEGSPGGGGTLGEGSPWAWAYRMVPYIPVYDIKGGFGGNAVGESGNATNPVAVLFRNKDDYFENYKAFGNAFAEIMPIEGLTLRTSFGIDFGYFFNRDITYRTYESSENTSITGYGTNSNYGLTWTWTNTAAYDRTFGDHNVKLLLGSEAISSNGNGIGVGTNTFDFEDPNFINLNTDQFSTPNAYSNQPIPSRLASLFGRVDYIFANKYLFNATIRRDGTSKIYKTERYGVFPSVGVGWRISEETFLRDVAFLDDLKLRFGWGQMGSIDNVSAGNQFTLFSSGVGFSNYDINRTNSSLAVGYTPYRAGSLTTRWEFSETTNIGLDASLFQGQWVFGLNYFINNTKDLLVSKVKNGLEPQVLQPAINLGRMQNKGFEFNLTNRKTFGDFSYDVTLLFTHYKNEVLDIDGNPETFFTRNASRLSNVVRTSVGEPVSYFWGYQIDGFFNSESEIQAVQQDGAVVGSWRFKDQNGDGKINDEDIVKLGSPHPDFVTSLNVDLRYKGFDFNMFWFWNQGNELYNYNKYFTDMRVFVGGVSKRVLYEGWTPENTNATLPRLAPGAESGYTSFIRSNSNDYFIEDGSYLRLRTMQLGYTLSPSILNKLMIDNARIYVQGQNILTITKYSGPDPDINITGQNPGDDLKMGVDESGFPTPRQWLLGLNITF